MDKTVRVRIVNHTLRRNPFPDFTEKMTPAAVFFTDVLQVFERGKTWLLLSRTFINTMWGAICRMRRKRLIRHGFGTDFQV